MQTLRESSVEHVGLGCVLFLWGRGRGRSHIISDSSEGDNHFFFRRRYCLTSSYMKSIFLPRLLLIIVAQYFGRFFSCKWRLRIERICWAVFETRNLRWKAANIVNHLFEQEDKGFDRPLFERQMAVMRGQVFDIAF